jgi:hypothetical protein
LKKKGGFMEQEPTRPMEEAPKVLRRVHPAGTTNILLQPYFICARELQPVLTTAARKCLVIKLEQDYAVFTIQENQRPEH